jgi:hypothetical protein
MCDFSENNVKCCKKNTYGQFCNKHKRNHLVENDLIVMDRFTCKSSDYLKNDIINTLNKSEKTKYSKSLKKDIVYNVLLERYNKVKYYNNNLRNIMTIQYRYKYKYNKANQLLRGEGFLKKLECNNQEDFFTYETVNEIEDKYFFSYKDEQNIIWFFDIRSLNKLIEMQQPNPYTMVDFNPRTIIRANKLINNLKNNNISLNFKDEMKELKKDKKSILKQKMVDLSAAIERLGYSFNLEWFKTLHSTQLRHLYRLLEDMWNYRAQLHQSVKDKICPPNGIVFNIPPHEIRTINRDNMREIIVNDVMKFNTAQEDSDKKLGFMYFLICLGKVNPSLYNVHEWIIYIDGGNSPHAHHGHQY